MDTIGSYMSVPVHSISAESSVAEMVKQMEEKNIGSLLITQNDNWVGIITERDLTRKVVGKGLDPKTTVASQIMSSPIITLEGNEPVEKANKFMAQKKIRHLAVTENGKIVGILSVRDLVSFYANPRLRDSEHQAAPKSPFRARVSKET